MSLDQNLFTLAITASTEENGAVDLTDPSSNTIYYRKRFNAGDAENAYSWNFYEPLSGGLLCTVTASNASSKQKWIELHNPEAKVELGYTGTFTFKWCFDWEGHTFEWRRESCYLLRKPDPPVQVAVTREPAGKIRTSQVQLLDFDLNRFDIEDRKGLEIIMLASLMTFQDYSEALKGDKNGGSPSAPPSRHNSDGPATPTTVAEVISNSQAVNRVQKNNVIIGDDASVEDYANHCVHMLKDPSLLYLVLRSQSPDHVPKVIQVAEATKRTHYKTGGYNEELNQYVTMEDEKPQANGPKIIKLDDDKHKKKKEKDYKPPQMVVVHLSKIPMPELAPKARPSTKPSPPSTESSLRPPTKPGRTPSPSRPASSSPGPSHPNKITKPSSSQHPTPQHTPQSSDPYRYPMVLYPPTGPPPSFPNPKPHKGKDKKNNQPNNQPPPQHQMNGPYPVPGAWPSTPNQTPGAMNSNRPPTQPQQPSRPASQGYYPSFPNPSSPAPMPGQYNGPPPPGPPPSHNSQPQQPHTLTSQLTTGIAHVGYNLLSKLAPPPPPPQK